MIDARFADGNNLGVAAQFAQLRHHIVRRAASNTHRGAEECRPFGGRAGHEVVHAGEATEALCAVTSEQFDLVLTGLQSDDQGFAQTGVVLAELLGITHATIIMEVQVVEGGLRVKRELEGGWFQWVSMPSPALLTIQSGINQLRYATLRGIMAAKKKEVRVVEPPADLAPHHEILELYVPEKAKQTRLIEGSPVEAATELVRVLREEARVI